MYNWQICNLVQMCFIAAKPTQLNRIKKNNPRESSNCQMTVGLCPEIYGHHQIPRVLSDVFQAESHCSTARPAQAFHRLESLFLESLAVQHGFVEVRLPALTPSWHFGVSGSPTSRSCVFLSWGISPAAPGGWCK